MVVDEKGWAVFWKMFETVNFIAMVDLELGKMENWKNFRKMTSCQPRSMRVGFQNLIFQYFLGPEIQYFLGPRNPFFRGQEIHFFGPGNPIFSRIRNSVFSRTQISVISDFDPTSVLIETHRRMCIPNSCDELDSNLPKVHVVGANLFENQPSARSSSWTST